MPQLILELVDYASKKDIDEVLGTEDIFVPIQSNTTSGYEQTWKFNISDMYSKLKTFLEIPIATETVLGGIYSSNNDGNGNVDNHGILSVNGWNNKANLFSPVFTNAEGNTPSEDDNSTSLATTEWVNNTINTHDKIKLIPNNYTDINLFSLTLPEDKIYYYRQTQQNQITNSPVPYTDFIYQIIRTADLYETGYITTRIIAFSARDEENGSPHKEMYTKTHDGDTWWPSTSNNEGWDHLIIGEPFYDKRVYGRLGGQYSGSWFPLAINVSRVTVIYDSVVSTDNQKLLKIGHANISDSHGLSVEFFGGENGTWNGVNAINYWKGHFFVDGSDKGWKQIQYIIGDSGSNMWSIGIDSNDDIWVIFTPINNASKIAGYFILSGYNLQIDNEFYQNFVSASSPVLPLIEPDMKLNQSEIKIFTSNSSGSSNEIPGVRYYAMSSNRNADAGKMSLTIRKEIYKWLNTDSIIVINMRQNHSPSDNYIVPKPYDSPVGINYYNARALTDDYFSGDSVSGDGSPQTILWPAFLTDNDSTTSKFNPSYDTIVLTHIRRGFFFRICQFN